MNPNENLETRIAALEKWKADRERQQLTLPLDTTSLNILNGFFTRIVDTLTYTAGGGGNTFTTYFGQQGNLIFELNSPSLISYTVVAGTDFVSISGTFLKFFNNQAVTLLTTGTAPAPLSAGLGTVYYVVSSDNYNFKLAETEGGAAIDITNTGSGRQFIEYA